MSTQAIPFWQSIRNAFLGRPRLDHVASRRIRVTEDEARLLPQDARAIRVFSGGAWVSHRGQDFVLREGQTLSLCDDHDGAVVTSIGRQPVVLEFLGQK